jgi:hypothetical protein
MELKPAAVQQQLAILAHLAKYFDLLLLQDKLAHLMR